MNRGARRERLTLARNWRTLPRSPSGPVSGEGFAHRARSESAMI